MEIISHIIMKAQCARKKNTSSQWSNDAYKPSHLNLQIMTQYSDQFTVQSRLSLDDSTSFNFEYNWRIEQRCWIVENQLMWYTWLSKMWQSWISKKRDFWRKSSHAVFRIPYSGHSGPSSPNEYSMLSSMGQNPTGVESKVASPRKAFWGHCSFVVYVNDFLSTMEISIQWHADDAKLYATGKLAPEFSSLQWDQDRATRW